MCSRASGKHAEVADGGAMEGQGRHQPCRSRGWGRRWDVGCYEEGFAPALEADV
jgi:hypothetical protein